MLSSDSIQLILNTKNYAKKIEIMVKLQKNKSTHYHLFTNEEELATIDEISYESAEDINLINVLIRFMSHMDHRFGDSQ